MVSSRSTSYQLFLGSIIILIISTKEQTINIKLIQTTNKIKSKQQRRLRNKQ